MRIKNFDELYNNHFSEIFFFCHKMVKNKQDAEELANESFVKAYFNYDPAQNTSFRTYIFKITTNLCIDFQRGKRYKRTKKEITLDETLKLSSSPDIEDKIENEEIMHIVRQCLDKLNSEDKSIVILYYLSNFVYREIAGIMEKSISTIKNRIKKGIALLTKCLQKNGITIG